MPFLKNKKIGIMTFFKEKNYGAALQAYALMETISDMGYDAEFLNYTNNFIAKSSTKQNSYLKLLKASGFGVRKFFRARRAFKKVPAAFQKFRNDFFKVGKEPLYDFEDLENIEHNYRGFVTGSDMVWTDIGQNLSAYYLRFTEYDKRISFSPSLTGCAYLSENEVNLYTEYIKGIKKLSFREEEGVKFAKKNAKVQAQLTCDPTLLFNKFEWLKKLNLDNEQNSDYILFYMFEGVSKKLKNEVEKIAKERKLKIRYIPTAINEYDEELKNGFHGVYGPKEFVEIFSNAAFVITNSFHGLMFSLIFEKPFLVMRRNHGNKWKANEARLDNILNLVNCQNRYVDIDHRITEEDLSLDYSEISKKLNLFRIESKEYLQTALMSLPTTCEETVSEKKITDISEVGIKSCSGCSACVHVCPKKCIRMEYNEEGFCYPAINKQQCIKCGLCLKHCPSISGFEHHYPLKTLLGFGKNTELTENSASGGVFSTLANSVLGLENGVVFGAALDENLKCRHIYIDSVDELKKLQNSKYVQSDIGKSFVDAKHFLEEGRFVLFSGTPCQIAGLKAYLKKDYDNLITLDLVCHGVPSQKFLDKDISQYRKKYKFDYITFRSKKSNLKNKSAYKLTLRKSGKCVLTKNSSEDVFYNAFIKSVSYRENCYYCKFAVNKRVGDITIGDCDSWREYPDFYPDQVKSIILLNTRKGVKFFEDRKKEFVVSELCYEKECLVNTPLSQPSERGRGRDSIYKDIERLSWKNLKKIYVAKGGVIKSIVVWVYNLMTRN